MKKNIVLIGLSGCGKTSIGKRLAHRLHMPLLDTDAMIVQKTGRSIPDIFAQDGEAFFRDLESDCAREASARCGIVISTGGGMVLRSRNMELLSENGLICFIDRHPSLILRSTTLSDRPLVQSDKEKLFRLHAERIALYRRWADITLVNGKSMNGRIKRGVLRIIKHWKKRRSACQEAS
ncbi:MAG: shikimate kinase [Mailhella sp.]|nr:shikimate kinase [Mailhella sp.]